MTVLSLTVVSLLVTVALMLGLTGLAWRFRGEPGAKTFGILQALSALWAGLTVVGLSLPPGPLRRRVWGVTNGTSLVVIVLWLAFIVRYTGQAEWLTRRRFGALSLPLGVGAVLYAVAPEWSLFVGPLTESTIPAGTVVEASIGPVGAVLGAYIYVVFLLGLLLVVRTMIEGNSLFVGQAAALALGTVVSVAGSMLSIAGVPTAGYPTTQVALGVQTLFWGYAVFGQQFLQTVPAVATVGERTVLEDIDEGVLVVDTGGTITRANEPANFYLEADDLVGQSVTPIYDRIGVTGLADLPARFESGKRTYRLKSSRVTDWRGRTLGDALVIQDVTRLFRRQQRLEVLNRILRHNVRNSMNVAFAVGDLLQKKPDDELVRMGEMLSGQAEDLTTISEKAIEIDRTLKASSEAERVDPETLVERVVAPLAADYPDATVTTRVAPDRIRVDRRMLKVVLTEIVENAVEHAGEAPEVSIAVERTSDTVRIDVTDDGPGIPRTELDPMVEGEETDLEHASSLGMWLIHWGTRSLGGELEFATTEDGSTVAVVLPVKDMETSSTSTDAERTSVNDD